MYLLKLTKKQEMKLFACLTPPDLNIMSINVIYSGGNAQMEVNKQSFLVVLLAVLYKVVLIKYQNRVCDHSKFWCGTECYVELRCSRLL